MRRLIRVVMGVSVLWVGGCSILLTDRGGTAAAPESVPQLAYTLRAESGRCDKDLLVVRRQGRSVLVTLTVQSVGGRHIVLIPDLGIRRTVKEGTEETIQFLADRSGIYTYGCTPYPFLGPFAWKGKITVD